ncbi:MAG: hypothetical protein K0Q73_8924 [Paenibacillus sp.]|jgi:hypothetical protein|nr:hypothetical protein [Paenibacillus sp.]
MNFKNTQEVIVHNKKDIVEISEIEANEIYATIIFFYLQSHLPPPE